MDAVLAIAITLPVTELHAPEPTDGDLAAAYLKLAPEYAAYALSVILIGLYWASSHFTGKLLQKTDHGYNLLSIGFLAAVSITPFPARPLIEHLGGDAESKTAVLAYLGVAAAPAAGGLKRASVSGGMMTLKKGDSYGLNDLILQPPVATTSLVHVKPPGPAASGSGGEGVVWGHYLYGHSLSRSD